MTKKIARSASSSNHRNAMRAKNPMKTLKRILGYWKPYTAQLIGALVCMIANVLCNIAGTFML